MNWLLGGGPGFPRVKNQPGTVHSAADTSLFATVIRWVRASDFVKSQTTAYPLQIDPHPLRANLRQRGESPNLTLTESDFAAVDSAVLRRREGTLQRLEVPAKTALSYFKECCGRGVPRPIKEEEAKHTQVGPVAWCNSGQAESINVVPAIAILVSLVGHV